MKRFFMYCVVIIGTLFVGLTFYMFAKNNEIIEYTIPQGGVVYLNVGETFDLPVNHIKKDKRTTIEIKSDNAEMVAYDSESNKFQAKAGGTVTVHVTPSNTKFAPLSFSVRVGDGSIDNPYFISNIEQLTRIGQMESLWTLDHSYEVVANLDFKETWIDSNPVCWTPIGTKTKPFTGIFNGGTKTIANLFIDDTFTGDYAGLFGYVASGAKVERVTLSEATINVASNNVGAIAGYSEGIVTRCKTINSKIAATSETAYAGGIVGVAQRADTEVEVSMCQVDGGEVNSANVVGGVVGKITSGVVANCKSATALANSEDVVAKNAGGLIGEIKAQTFTQNLGEAKELTYNTLVQTNLVISSFGKKEEAYLAGSVAVVSAIDSLTGEAQTNYVGNIAYNEDLTSAQATVVTRQDLEDQTKYVYTNEFSQDVAWDFDGTWSMENKTEADTMGAYVILDGAGQNVKPLRNGAEINKSNAIEIFGKLMVAGNSAETAQILNYNYVVTEDIEIDAKEAFVNGWTPIGNAEFPFGGSIYAQEKDGKKAKIVLKNVVIPAKNITEHAKEKTAGIFGTTSASAQIFDIEVFDLIIHSDLNTTVGGLVGKNQGLVKQSSITGLNVKNGSHIGGLAGKNSGNISLCVVLPSDTLKEVPEGKTGEVNLDTKLFANGKTNKYVGGLVGQNSGTLYCSTAEIIIEASSDSSSYVGGLVGQNSGIVDLCAKNGGESKAGGNVIRIGGLVGDNMGSLTSSYSSLSSIVASKNNASYAGGLVGSNGDAGVVEACYFEGTMEGRNVGGLGGIVGGTIYRCYSKAAIQSSVSIGGVAHTVTGKVSNSYFEATAKIGFADGENNNYAGLVIKLPKGGLVEKCYTSTTSGVGTNGRYDPETVDSIRSVVAEFFEGGLKPNSLYGTLQFNVINSNGTGFDFTGYNIGTLFVGSKAWSDEGWKPRWIDVSGEGLTQTIIDFFTSTCQFDTSIWDFKGLTPNLANLNLEEEIDEEFEIPGLSISLPADVANFITKVEGEDKINVAAGWTVDLEFNFDVTIQNSMDIPTATLKEGSSVEVVKYENGKAYIKIKAAGTSIVELTLGDIVLSVTIEVAESPAA